eukprot:4173427-Prymnesium_polylepis.1
MPSPPAPPGDPPKPPQPPLQPFKWATRFYLMRPAGIYCLWAAYIPSLDYVEYAQPSTAADCAKGCLSTSGCTQASRLPGTNRIAPSGLMAPATLRRRPAPS